MVHFDNGQQFIFMKELPGEIMLRIVSFVAVSDYFTFRNLSLVFPELTAEISREFAYFVIRGREQCGLWCPSTHHATEESSFKFFKEWFNKNIVLNREDRVDDQIESLKKSHRYFEFRDPFMPQSNFGLGTYIGRYNPPYTTRFSPCDYLKRVYGYPPRRKTLSSIVEVKHDQHNLDYLRSYRYAGLDLSYLRAFDFLYKRYSLFNEAFLELRKDNKIKNIVVIVDSSDFGINVDLAVVLTSLFTKPQNGMTDVPTSENITQFNFSLISLKYESNMPRHFLDCGLYHKAHVSLFDCLSGDVNLSYLDSFGQNELIFELSDESKRTIEEGLNSNALRKMPENEATAERGRYYTGVNTITQFFDSLSAMSNFRSYDVVFFRNIEETYREINVPWIKLTKKKYSNWKDIRKYEPRCSIYKNPQALKRNLSQLQQTYNAIIEKYHSEIITLEREINNQNFNLAYCYCFLQVNTDCNPVPSMYRDQKFESKLTKKHLLYWKRIDLFNDFMYHLPWMKGNRPFQIRMNLFRQR